MVGREHHRQGEREGAELRGDRQLVLGGRLEHRQRRDLEAGQLDVVERRVDQIEHDAGHREAARGRGRDQALERELLVCERVEQGSSDPVECGARRVVEPEPGAQRDQVDESADQRLDVARPAVGDRDPQRLVDQVAGDAAGGGEREVDRGQHDHERRDAPCGGERRERRDDGCRQRAGAACGGRGRREPGGRGG